MRSILGRLICCLLFAAAVIGTKEDLRVLVTSEDMPRERSAAHALKKKLIADGVKDVRLMHESQGAGHFAFFTWLSELSPMWTLVVPVDVEVDVEQVQGLTRTGQDYLGELIRDDDRSLIIHHYGGGISYPNMRTGFLVSPKIVEIMREKVKLMDKHQFVIDPIHEFAKYLKDKESITLTGVEQWSSKMVRDKFHDDGREIPSDKKLLVAIKTTSKFREKRIEKMVKKEWGKDPRLKVLYMTDEDVDEENFVNLKVNTDTGHCAKMRALLLYLATNYADEHFVMISDDDALYHVDNLLNLVFAQDYDKPLYLGERYAYASGDFKRGTTFITTGGGMVLSKHTLKKLMDEGIECRKADTPDDMQLGIWMHRLGIPALHSAQFHQRKPDDYHPTMLNSRSISFHNVLWADKDYRPIRDFLIPPKSAKEEEICPDKKEKEDTKERKEEDKREGTKEGKEEL